MFLKLYAKFCSLESKYNITHQIERTHSLSSIFHPDHLIRGRHPTPQERRDSLQNNSLDCPSYIADLHFRSLVKYMSYISKTACFPVNYKEPSPRHSLQLWKECGEWSCKALNGYHSLNVADGLGRIRDSSCQDCLSQSEAFLPLSLGHSTIKPGA